MKIFRTTLTFLSFPICFSLYSQTGNSNIDSLKNLLLSAKGDTNKINLLNGISREFFNLGESGNAIIYGKEAKALSVNTAFKKGIAYSSYNIGKAFLSEHKTKEAREQLFLALSTFEETGYRKGVAVCYGDIAISFKADENYEKAIENYIHSLRINEDINNMEGVSFCLTDIGILYFNMQEFSKAIEYFDRCLHNDSLLGDKYYISKSLNNLGNALEKSGNIEKAFSYHEKALSIRREIEDSSGIGESLGNLSIIYEMQGNYSKAMEYNQSALNIFSLQSDVYNISISLSHIAEILFKQNDFSSALIYAKHSLSSADEAGSKILAKNAHKTLAEIYSGIKDYKNAYNHFVLFSNIKDTLMQEEGSKNIARLQTIYETDQKQKEIELLNKNQEIQTAENKRQRIMIYSTVGGLGLVLSLAFFIFRGYKEKQKANLLLEKKNIAISQQKEEIEKQKYFIEDAHKVMKKKNEEITDSINYAKRIQEAILPGEEYLKKCFGSPLPLREDGEHPTKTITGAGGQEGLSHFVLFKPKDIVSGDFFWAYQTPDNKLIWAAVDCTGHGVPGAFMSMIGNSLLNEIVIENGIEDSDQILNNLRDAVIKSLKQTGQAGKQKDGMDIALCVWDRARSSENLAGNGNANSAGILQFSGANNPLWLFKKGQAFIYKPDKQPIGYYSETIKPFTKQVIPLQKGDVIYTFTDGFEDQFGGQNGKKFMAKKFRELLASICEKPMTDQKQILDMTIEEWKGPLEQIDDICVIGVRA